MTVQQMIELVRGKMREMHIPGFLSYFMLRSIPKLKRWAGEKPLHTS
jgi:hypothetical protein